MAYLYVGVTENYTAIQDAVDAASSGDIVIVEPATYNESVVILDKAVSLRANTTDPIGNPVTINSTVAADEAITVDHQPAGIEDVYIEGFTLTKADSSWTRVFITYPNSNLRLFINRCHITAGANQYPIGCQSTGLHTLEVRNCYLEKGYNHFVNANWTATPNNGIYATELNTTYGCQSCTGAPSTNDNVTTTTSGYGPAYGEYYLFIPVATCSGITYVNDVATGNIPVRLYRRSSGELVAETTSVSGGLFEIPTPYEETHYVVGLYPASGTNALIYDWIDPTYSG